MKEECYESYPLSWVFISNIVQFCIYAAGAFVIYQLDWIWLVLYILYIVGLEIRLLRRSCANCYYHGKVCAFGKGKLSCLFFKKGDTDKFKEDKITWIDIAPDFLVSLIPIAVGVVLLIIDFNWLLFLMVLIVIIFTFFGNGLIRGSLACKYCKQREIGCPAEQLFNRDKT
jgi:hypothetical protein